MECRTFVAIFGNPQCTVSDFKLDMPRAETLRRAGVKLLLDENLSDRIISRVADLFPDSTHIKAVGLREAMTSSSGSRRMGLRLYLRIQIFIKGPLCLATRRSSYGYASGIARLA